MGEVFHECLIYLVYSLHRNRPVDLCRSGLVCFFKTEIFVLDWKQAPGGCLHKAENTIEKACGPFMCSTQAGNLTATELPPGTRFLKTTYAESIYWRQHYFFILRYLISPVGTKSTLRTKGLVTVSPIQRESLGLDGNPCPCFQFLLRREPISKILVLLLG